MSRQRNRWRWHTRVLASVVGCLSAWTSVASGEEPTGSPPASGVDLTALSADRSPDSVSSAASAEPFTPAFSSDSASPHLSAADAYAAQHGGTLSPAEALRSTDTATSSTTPDDATTSLALPTGADKSGVTSKTISVPKGSGTIQGMGESFSAQLSTGIATFSVPFALPSARGKAQPSLGLSYSSSGGFDIAGVGWSVGVPFIARQTDRGVPTYNDQADWNAEQDHFVFNGGQELVPICTVKTGLVCTGALKTSQAPADQPDLIPSDEVMPSWSPGWQYFRPRVEGSFLRFFWSPDHETWRVQDKSGVTMELGVPLDGSNYASALDVNPDKPSEIYRWHLVRQFDTYADAGKPVNVVVYRFVQDGGMAYVSDIFDTTPASNPTTLDLSLYAHHTRLVYETRTDPTVSYRSGWRIDQGLRLARVEVTSKTFDGAVTDARHMVRRYHLTYATDQHASLLASVQVEGRCEGDERIAPPETSSQGVAATSASSGSIEASTNCPRLPAMTFDYSHVTPLQTDGAAGVADLPGYEGFDERIISIAQSPPHSLDEGLSDLFDINSDGLPDLLVTAPGLYGGGHGVFFNADGGTADRFGAVQEMGVRGVLGATAGDITLDNLNLVPLDLDADATVNLLHMPAVKTYSIYTPQLESGKWWWEGRTVTTAGQQNVKIDFGKDTLDHQVLDVNFDGLVDVVVSTGTEFQTFLSLGRYPGGDGQFGQGTRTDAETSQLSNDPIRTCVPWAGTPVRFSDPDIKLADMNGDGITDIVRLRRGDILYWPGRGNGFWGTGLRDDCKAGTFGSGREIRMDTSPYFSDIQGDSLRLDDVNGDGLSDLVQVRFTDVDVWLNVDGVGWTERHIIKSTPASPSYANRVRLVDVNGSGTPDILWGDGGKYKYIDLDGGIRPQLLVGVANGLGKTTDIEYSTSTTEMLAAEKLGGSCAGDLETIGFTQRWCTKMPTVTHVVKRVTEHDNLTVAGRPPASYLTEYSYRDPVFEGRQREFRGFRKARAKRIGDDNSPTDITESTFLLGECEDETPANGVDDCSLPERWRDNPREALKGLPMLTEKFDEAGTYLSTDASQYRLRTLYTGLDGRLVRYAFESGKKTYLYDTGPFHSAPGTDDVTVVSNEHVLGVTDSTRLLTVKTRSTTGMATITSDSVVDAYGNRTVAKAHGTTDDETITTVTVPGRRSDDASGWLWRTIESYVTGDAHPDVTNPTQRDHTHTAYTVEGDPNDTTAELDGSVPLDRFRVAHAGVDSSTAVAGTPTTASAQGPHTVHVSQQVYDLFGNLTDEKGANGRCRAVLYDLDPYHQLPTAETISAGAADGTNSEAFGDACGHNQLTTTALYDRGLGLVTEARDMQFQPTAVSYDSFGRLTALHKPDPDAEGVASTEASVKVEYFLPPDVGSNAHHSVIHTMVQDGSDPTDASNYLESWQFIDGFGRPIVTLNEADKQNGHDDGAWIASSLLEYDQKSAVRRKYLEFFTDANGDPKHFDFAAQPSGGYGRQRYDAFGRQVQTFDLDGTVTLQSVYHALGTDLYDAADLEPGPHQGSFASEQKDGLGRTKVVTERFHEQGVIEKRQVITDYLPTGEPERITRRRREDSSTDVVRWMRYDTLGRMVLNVEPNTTLNFTTNIAANEAGLKAWRYVYDDAGDLVATSDARGCGVNYAYDAAGRLLSEDYSPCTADHDVYTAADLTARTGIEVLYQYDTRPDFALIGGSEPDGYNPPATFLQGRLAAVYDRGTVTWTTYDGRGRVTRTDVRVTNPTQVQAFDQRYAPRWYTQRMAYDAADRNVAQTTGATVGQLLGEHVSVSGFGTDNQSVITTTYTNRGVVGQVGGSYQRSSDNVNGSLVSKVTREADGRHREIVYGDLANTTTAFSYDNRRRLSSVQTYRGPPSSWSSPPSDYLPAPIDPNTPTTLQLLLQDEDYVYDSVGNPTEIRDWRNPDEWPAGAKPVTRKVQYDDLYRATRVDYEYSSGDDEWVPPFDHENKTPSTDLDPRLAKPSPHVNFDKRVKSQTYQYDWLGNTQTTGDDARGFYDRSLGTITNGTAAQGPYQLKSASNKTGSGTGREGELSAIYDAAGNMIALAVQRLAVLGEQCLPATGQCTQRFHYDWDEVGRLVRARRWDHDTSEYQPPTSEPPSGTPAADLAYRYDASDQRVLKTATDAAGAQSHTLYVFDTLELRRASFASDYTLNEWTEVPYLSANGGRLARVAYEPSAAPTIAAQQRHVFFELGDQLGSTSVVLDQATGELVERSTTMAYGAAESDYRPDRWRGFREDYRFTGKEEDAEVGLAYFGARFLSTNLNRWVSADPLGVHLLGADPNLYAYVTGRVLKSIDPLGLEDGEGGTGNRSNQSAQEGASSTNGADPITDEQAAQGWFRQEQDQAIAVQNGTAISSKGPSLAPTYIAAALTQGTTGILNVAHAEANSRPDAGVGESELPPGGLTEEGGREGGMLSDPTWRTAAGMAADYVLVGAAAELLAVQPGTPPVSESPPRVVPEPAPVTESATGANNAALHAQYKAELRAQTETRVVAGATVKPKGQPELKGNVDVGPTLDRISGGGPKYPYKNDGTIFENRDNRLTPQYYGYYHEYVVPTPGVKGAGPQRVVTGNGGELWYTPDHYKNFTPLN